MIKVLIFDFDYTLGDSTQGVVLSVNYALESLGYGTRSVEEIKKTIGLSLKETFRTLSLSKDAAEAEEFARLFKLRADSVMVENTNLYDGVKDILQTLKADGYGLAIATTKFHYRIDQILSKFCACDLIDKIVGAEDVKIEKPDPEGLLWLIGEFGVSKDEVLYVGDSLVDAQTAKNAGVSFAAVLTGTTTRAEFSEYGCAWVAENIADVYEYVKNK